MFLLHEADLGLQGSWVHVFLCCVTTLPVTALGESPEHLHATIWVNTCCIGLFCGLLQVLG